MRFSEFREPFLKNWSELSQFQPVAFLESRNHSEENTQSQSIDQDFQLRRHRFLVPLGRTDTLCKGSIIIFLIHDKSGDLKKADPCYHNRGQ